MVGKVPVDADITALSDDSFASQAATNPLLQADAMAQASLAASLGLEPDAAAPVALPPALDVSQIPQQAGDVSMAASLMPAPLRAPMVSTKPLREQRAKVGEASKKAGLARAGALGEQKSAISDQAKAITDLAGAQAKSAEAVAGAIESRNARIASAQGMAIKREQAARHNVQDRMAGWRAARAERDTMKIDPDAWYRDKHGSTAGRRIGAAVSVAFGAIGQAFSGGPNTALRIIEGSIDRNLAAQRSKMMQADKSVQGAKEDMTSARQHFSDIEAVNAAERAEIMADAAAQIEALTLRAKTPEIQARGQQLVAELRTKSADLEAAAAENEFTAEMRTLAAEGGIIGQEMSIKGKNAQRAFDAKKASLAMQAKASIKPGSMAPPGLRQTKEAIERGIIPSKEDLKLVKEVSSAWRKADSLFGELINWRTEHGAETIDRTAVAEGKRLAALLIIELKKTGGMGANFSDMEKELIGIPDDPGEFGHVLAKLKTDRRIAAIGVNDSMYAYGFELDQGTGRRRAL